jgi:hypothetical protein
MKSLFAPFSIVALAVGCTVTAQPVPFSPSVSVADAAPPGVDSGSGSDAGDQCSTSSTMYDGASFEANAKDELALRPLYGALSQLLKDGEAGTKAPTAAELRALFDAGAPSLRSLTAPGFAADVDALVDSFAASVGQTYTPSATLPATGGVYGPYIFTKNGVDIRQAIEKGLFGALFYRSAVEIAAKSDFAASDVDRLLALFGAHPRFPGDDKDATNPDVLSAIYAERRDKKDANAPGPYLKFRNAAVRAQFAATKGAACQSEQRKAVAEMLRNWELALAGTLVFYMNDAGPKLDGADATKWPAALHGYGEVIAFVDGMRFAPSGNRVMQDAQIGEFLTLLRAPTKATAEAYIFATGQGIASIEFGKSISKLVTVYGFNGSDIETFKTNY